MNSGEPATDAGATKHFPVDPSGSGWESVASRTFPLWSWRDYADQVFVANAGGDPLSQHSWQAVAFGTHPRCEGAHAALAPLAR